MSDETRPASLTATEVQLPPPAGIFEHWCEHPGCAHWGSFGFQRGRVPVYFCFRHRGDGENGR
jgi:hypothetical protein